MDNKIFDQIITEIGNGNFNVAIQHCDIILNDYPENRGVYEIRSGCYYALGNYDSAIGDLTSSIDKYPGGGESKDEIINLYTKRGKIYLEKGDWLKASEDFEKILGLNQNLSEIQNSLAVCYRKMDNYDEALYHSTQAIKLNQNYAEAYNNRANINISLGKYHEAIVDYTRSIELNPLSANVYFNRGSIYYDIINNKENGIQDFIKAVVINPNFKEEILNHYPELAKSFENTAEDSRKEQVSKEEVVSKEMPISDVKETAVPEVKETPLPEVKEEPISKAEIVPEHKDDDIGFSLDDFSLLFKDKQDDTLIPTFKVEEPLAEPLKEVKKADDIVIPEFDLKSLFNNSIESEEITQVEEEPLPNNKPLITEDVKTLHDEIQTNGNKEKDDSGLMGGVKFGGMPGFENKEPVFDTDPNSKHMVKSVEEKRSFLRSPIFFIILILLMGIIILLSVVKFFDSQENQQVNTQVDVKVDSAIVKKTDTLKVELKDTLSKVEPEKEAVTEKKQEEVKKEEPPKQNAELTTKNLGFISDKKQFVLFSEPDGYYVQIGSYKEKSKADEKLKLLEKNNIKGKVVEADLKEKGTFYRVRAGVFSSPEEAREKTIKIE